MDHKKQHHEYTGEIVESATGDKDLIWRLLRYLRPYRTLLITAICVLLFSKIIEASVPVFIGRLAQTVMDYAGASSQENTSLYHGVLQTGFFILGLLFLSYILDSANVILRSWIGQKGLYRLRMRLYDHVMHMPLVYFDRNTVGRLMTRTIHDVDQINQMFAESVIPIIGNMFLFAGIFIGILIIDWRIAILVFFIIPFVYWLTHRFRKYQRICYNRVRTVVAAMNTFVQEHLMGASIIRNFGLQSKAKKQFEEINEDYCNAYIGIIHQFSFFMAGIDLIQNASLVLAFVLIVLYSPIEGGFNVGIYLTFSLYALMFFRPLADLAERYNVLQSAMSAAVRIFDLLDRRSEYKIDTGNIELGEINTIAFEDVWFAYEDENWVLKGLSLEIFKGQSYAIVGMTGEGKSTMMSLLLRFYEPQKGRIVVNGLDIHEYTLSSLRSQFSLVLQDPVIFSGTVADNISLFDESISMDEIHKVVDYLGMRPLIDHFPEGLLHILQEQGKGLSMGEMQLLSLARAMVHSRSVLILDEATANVDSVTEQLMQKAIHSALKRQTALVIAHRLSTIKDAANILVMQGGKIAEIGTHGVLLEKKGIYEKLYRLQFENKIR
ncbi:MAG TPA: ABC transporter ATP-binding protein [Parachlamydiaceae bacterium]|nr:ABC transporter ATP-binding protein [Parachlamydiaceae bacterium]